VSQDAGLSLDARVRNAPDLAYAPPSSGRRHPESRTLDLARRAVVRVEAVHRVTGQSEGPWTSRTGFGFVVDENGIVLTAGRLVIGAVRVAIVLPGGRTLPVTAVTVDPLNDVAVLQVNEGRLQAIPLGSSSDLRVGDPLVALAGPVSGETVGTVRATGTATGGELVTDARPTGQPRAGLPLLNVRGEAVGVVTHTSEAGSDPTLDFAVPIDRAKRVLRDLRPAPRGTARGALPDANFDR
jgi:S1-C subfamily serine protease